MGFLLTWLWGWLVAAWFLGFATGWIAVVQRGPALSYPALQQAILLVAALVALAVLQVLPGRAGYGLDLALLLLAAYLVGCVPGAWLRARVVARHLQRQQQQPQ